MEKVERINKRLSYRNVGNRVAIVYTYNAIARIIFEFGNRGFLPLLRDGVHAYNTTV